MAAVGKAGALRFYVVGVSALRSWETAVTISQRFRYRLGVVRGIWQWRYRPISRLADDQREAAFRLRVTCTDEVRRNDRKEKGCDEAFIISFVEQTVEPRFLD